MVDTAPTEKFPGIESPAKEAKSSGEQVSGLERPAKAPDVVNCGRAKSSESSRAQGGQAELGVAR